MLALRSVPGKCCSRWILRALALLPSMPIALRGSELFCQILPQHHRLVVLLVLCIEKQRHRTLPAPFQTLLDRLLVLVQLGAVAAAELVPFLRVMVEPFSELGAGRYILDPFIVMQILLPDATRPEPIDQQGRALVASILVADPRDLDPCGLRHHAPSSASRSSVLIECAKAAPARISAATQIASMICSGVAPSRRAPLTWPSMHQGHCVTCA